MDNSTTSYLFIALSGIGNLLMQLPAIAAVRKANPTSRISIVVAPRGTKFLAEQCGYANAVIEIPIKTSVSGHVKNIKTLHREHFDVGIVLTPGQLIKSAAYLWLAGIPQRTGHTYPLGQNPHSALFLNHHIDEQEHMHDIEQNLELLKALNIAIPSSQVDYSLIIPPSFHEKANSLRQHLGLNNKKMIIGLHAGCAPSFLWKRWPIEQFAEVARQLIDRYQAHIVLFGGSDEETQKSALQQAINSPDVTPFSADLMTTAAFMRHCQFMLSNDSGLMHLAAASGTPTLGLFGPTNEKKTGPRGTRAGVIRAPGTTPIYNTEQNHNLGTEPHPTILAITPDLVIREVSKFLG